MLIREARSSDQTTLVAFQQAMAMETENITLDKNILEQGVGNLLADPSKGKYYVMENNGAVIACLMTTFEWSEWRNGTVLWIQSVYVDKDFRGAGVFKQLYEHIKDLVSDDPEMKGIRLYADRTNQNARNVYTRLGMNGDHYQVFEWIK